VARGEGRRSVLDVGAGPASDAERFIQAGIGYTGIDLAVANSVLASEAVVTVIAASLFDLPFPDAAFEAAWSMSTMMHVPTVEVDMAMRSICRVLAPGAPLMIEQWEVQDAGPDGWEYHADRSLRKYGRPDG
jgi:SAM-dependent methyltransferase